MFDLIGKTIGPYRVIEQVGVGGMATVYKAYQPSMDRYVAIKILPHYLSQDPEFVKRFQREARAIAKLEHAHILPVHDYGEYEGIAYIVMRYVEAGTLKDRMAQGQLPLDEIGRLIEQIGGALDYAHRLGVIHRDIKPGNVLLDTQGDTYLSDFGLARMMEATQQLTASGVGVGTPAYMSPEQGQGVKVDHRSDIYSLGVILYEMVTGKVPFEAETPMAVMIKHITDPLPLPRTVKPDVPEPIERVILKALAKDQAHRYQTAGEFVQALAVAVRNVSVPEAARPVVAEAAPARREDVSLVTRVQQLWEKPRGKAGLVGGAVVGVVLIALLLSRLPGSIAIVGSGVTPTGTTAAIAQAATPTSEATRPSPTHAPSPTLARPTATTIASTATSEPPVALANLKWEQLYDGTILQRADVSAIVADPQNPNVIYAATTGGLNLGTGAGIYKSVDGGETWVAVNDGLDHVSVSGLLIDPIDTQVIYATTFGAGPYKSTDSGAHWKPINAGLTQLTGAWNGASLLAFDPKDHLRLYHADPSAGIFYSTNGGETWQSISQPCQQFISLAVDPRDGGHLFAGAFYNPTCPGGLYESTDGGRSWTPIAQSIPDLDKAGVWRVVIDPSAPDSIYAHVEYPGLNRPSALITRTNGGKDWTVARTTGGRLAIAVNPNTSGNVYIGDGVELHRSDDGGRTWVSLRGGFEGNIATLTFGGDTLYVGAAGVYRTSNGGQSWKAGASGFGNTWLELAFDPPGKMLYAEDNHCALYDSPDGGLTWEKLRSSGCGLAFNRKNGVLYRADRNVLYSTDGGRTWSNTGKSPSGKDNYRIYVNPQDANTLYWLQSCCPPGPSLYRSTDGGQTWEGLPTVNDTYHGRMVIADDGTRMYIASYGDVEASDDGGQSWRACQATTNNNGNPPALALHPQDRDTLLLGTWGTGVLKTTNACESWVTANAGLENLYVNALAFDPRNPDVVYAGTDGGVFLSQDGGDSWSALNDGLAPNSIVYSIAVDPNDSTEVYAATPDGVYRLAGVSEPAETPSPQAEQARAFAEPILQAIADRKPDFADDFSTADKGWSGGNLRQNESAVVQNGVARLEVKEKDVSFGNEALNRKDFVLQVEARVAEGDKATQLIVNFHGLSSEYWFYVVVNSAGHTWLVDKHVPGDQRNLANGSGNVSLFGETTRIMIVARGPRAAIYLNGTPAAYFEDADFDTSGGTGLFCQSLDQAVCEFDNVKFWNLNNVPGLP